MEKIHFESEYTNSIKKYLITLFNKLYKQSNDNYDLTLTKITEELGNPITDYENRIILTHYLLAKAVEINQYRIKMGIMNEEQDHSIEIMNKLKTGNSYITKESFKTIINDALYYIFSTNKAYQQDVIKKSFEKGLNKDLYKLSPILSSEHLNVLMEEFAEKDAILADIEKAITMAFDIILFSQNEHPSPESRSQLFTKPLQNLFMVKVMNAMQEDDDDKILMCEILYTVLSKKEKSSSLSFLEFNLLHHLNDCKKERKELLQFYDEHRFEIISFFTRNSDGFYTWKKEGMLEDQNDFANAKNQKK